MINAIGSDELKARYPRINISMCRRGKDWGIHPVDFPIIELGEISIGQLLLHGAYRMPTDPVWTVETIGM